MIPFYLRFAFYAAVAAAAVYYTDAAPPFFYTMSAFGLLVVACACLLGWMVVTLSVQTLRALMSSADATRTVLLDACVVAVIGGAVCMFVQGTTPLDIYETLMGYNDLVRWWITKAVSFYQLVTVVQ